MGLIMAALGAAGGVLADQWKDFFYCESLPKDVLVTKGQKRVGKRSTNTKGSENIISNGSIVAVADGQCMMIVEQGKIVEVCAQPGEYTYDQSTEPSIFAGNLGKGIKDTFASIGRRFTFGGDTGKDQRVYYFNLKELVGNKFGTSTPVPFRVVDKNIGLDVDISLRCNGEYSYKIADPLLFYTNVCGNVDKEYNRENIDSQLKSEFLTALQPAFARISEMGIRYSAIPGHALELSNALNAALTAKWAELRGLAVVSVALNSLSASKEDEDMIKQIQKSAVMRDPTMAGAALVSAQSDAMRAAASNTSGAMNGFMGVNMSQQAGGMNAQSLFAMGQQQQGYAQQQPQPGAPQQRQQPGAYAQPPQGRQAEPKRQGWACACGAEGNTGKFCAECGASKPPEDNGWACTCGAVNKGKFCAECGKPKPAGVPQYRCDKCGWEPEDKSRPPKFCPECGDPFDDGDLV